MQSILSILIQGDKKKEVKAKSETVGFVKKTLLNNSLDLWVLIISSKRVVLMLNHWKHLSLLKSQIRSLVFIHVFIISCKISDIIRIIC